MNIYSLAKIPAKLESQILNYNYWESQREFGLMNDEIRKETVPLNKLDDIKKKNERRKELAIIRKNEYSMTIEVEYNHLMNSSINDIEYLLSLVKKQREALQDNA